MSCEFRPWRLRAVGYHAFCAFGIAGFLLSGPPAEAQPKTTTNIKYYIVNGTTADSLDREMISRGPMHGRSRAYANIVAVPEYSGQLVQGRTCRLENFQVSGTFTMTLPRLADGVRLSGDLKARWNSFKNFVRRHEEGHRAIWIDTMKKAQGRISRLSAATCPQLQAKIDAVFQEEWRAGERRQDAFDRADQQNLARHPLIQAANSARRKMRATPAASTRAVSAPGAHSTTPRAMRRGGLGAGG
jgi:predicted secreted Zn-dependent protease